MIFDMLKLFWMNLLSSNELKSFRVFLCYIMFLFQKLVDLGQIRQWFDFFKQIFLSNGLKCFSHSHLTFFFKKTIVLQKGNIK